MLRQKTILKVLLASLGIAAVAGAGAVLLGGDEVALHVMGTAFFTAVAAGLLLPLARWMDRETTRRAALLGVTIVVIDYLLSLINVWELAGSRRDDEVWLTAMVLGLTGLAGMCFAFMLTRRTLRLAGAVGLACTAIDALLWLLAVWLDHIIKGSHQWWELAMIFTLYALPAVVCLVGQGQDRRHWRWLGVAASVIGFAVAAYHLFAEHSEVGEDVAAVAFSLAFVIAHANVVLRARIRPSQRWLGYLAVAATTATAAVLDVLIIADDLHSDELLARMAGAAGIVAGCATLAVVVLARLNRGVDVEPGTFEAIDITVICPRCRKKQTLPLGDARCINCDLRIHTRVEEPRCPQCGYLLYKLTSDACPECGAAIKHH